MNISSIADMLRADPSCADDLPAFLKQVNARNISRVKTTREIVAEETVLESLADACGGDCTERDVLDAWALLVAEPLLAAVDEKAAAIKAAVLAGEIADEAAIDAEFAKADG